MRISIFVLACAILFAVAITVRAQTAPEAGYSIVSTNMGPWLYRMNNATGEVCAIKVIEMDFAYKSRIPDCPGYGVRVPQPRKTDADPGGVIELEGHGLFR